MPEREWKTWMHDLGAAIRRTREVAGLAQHELAAAAGISQGTMSRLESGRGIATPLVVVLRVLSILQRVLESVPQEVTPLNLDLLLHMSQTGRRGPTTEADARLLRFLDIYRDLHPPERKTVLEVAITTARALRPKHIG